MFITLSEDNPIIQATLVPGGMLVHSSTLVDSSSGLLASESMVFVPCSQVEAKRFINTHSVEVDDYQDEDIEEEDYKP